MTPPLSTNPSTVPEAAALDFRSRAERLWLWACLALFGVAGLLIRSVLAVRWPTIQRPDETYQNLEPAYRLWTGWGVMPWEWRDGIRSWLFPDFLYGIMRATSLLHLPPDTALPAIWAVLSLLATGVVAVGVVLGWRQSGVIGAVLCGVLCAFWPDLVYFGPKTLLEVQAGNLLVIAAGLASLDPVDRRRRPWRLAAIGLLLAFAFALRFQLAPALGLVALWAARLDGRRWLALALGAAGPLALLGVVDAATWGSPFQSIWKNVLVNFVQGKADYYGIQPLPWYLLRLISRYRAALIPLGLFFCLGARRAPLLALVAVVVIGFHTLIGHKEISFIYAALPPAMIVVGLGSARFVEHLPRLLRAPPTSATMLRAAGAAWCVLMVLTGMAAPPYRQDEEYTGLRTAWAELRAQSDICGVGLYGKRYPFPWIYAPGYAGLNRFVPLYLMQGPEALARAEPGFNYLVVRTGDVPDLVGYELVNCSSNMCLMRRPQTCQPVPDMQINAVLARQGN